LTKSIIGSYCYPLDKIGIIKDAEDLAKKERLSFSQLIVRLLEDYTKIHKDGNPQFKIDDFGDPDFMACPAFYRDMKTWEEYIKKAEPKEREKIKQQILSIERKLLNV
jgi:hypothetical protein